MFSLVEQLQAAASSTSLSSKKRVKPPDPRAWRRDLIRGDIIKLVKESKSGRTVSEVYEALKDNVPLSRAAYGTIMDGIEKDGEFSVRWIDSRSGPTKVFSSRPWY